MPAHREDALVVCLGSVHTTCYISIDKSVEDSFKKVAIKYVGPLVIYKIIDPHSYLLMTLDGIVLRGFF